MRFSKLELAWLLVGYLCGMGKQNNKYLIHERYQGIKI